VLTEISLVVRQATRMKETRELNLEGGGEKAQESVFVATHFKVERDWPSTSHRLTWDLQGSLHFPCSQQTAISSLQKK
jgi:hypothetical protein